MEERETRPRERQHSSHARHPTALNRLNPTAAQPPHCNRAARRTRTARQDETLDYKSTCEEKDNKHRPQDNELK